MVIILGHLLSTIMVYRLCLRLHLGSTPALVAAVFFFFSPASLGATLACDGLNQTYAQLWGLVALWCYLDGGWHRILLWPLFIFVSVLSKENGLAWAVVPPLLSFAFRHINA